MASNFVQSALLRSALIGTYRIYARAQFWRKGPRIFINSIPKAGTHLLTSELERVPGLQNSRLWIRERLVNKLATRNEHRRDFVLDETAFQRFVNQVRPGQFFTGHLKYSDALLGLLKDNDIRVIFLVRHPLDLLASDFHYIKSLRRHSKHDFFTTVLKTDAQRMDTLINGNDNPPIASLRQKLEGYRGWLGASGVFNTRFEDLVGSRGGGDDDVRQAVFNHILEYVGLPDGDMDFGTKHRTKSATFRKGKMHGWMDTVSPDNVLAIKQECEDTITALGYRLD